MTGRDICRTTVVRIGNSRCVPGRPPCIDARPITRTIPASILCEIRPYGPQALAGVSAGGGRGEGGASSRRATAATVRRLAGGLRDGRRALAGAPQRHRLPLGTRMPRPRQRCSSGCATPRSTPACVRAASASHPTSITTRTTSTACWLDSRPAARPTHRDVPSLGEGSTPRAERSSSRSCQATAYQRIAHLHVDSPEVSQHY